MRWLSHALVVLVVVLLSPVPLFAAPELALKRGSTFFIDYNGDAAPDATIAYGAPTDVGIVADFNGDTISDLALYRSGFWFISLFNDSVVGMQAAFGGAGDVPLAADVDGDGKADLVIYRPGTGVWYVNYQKNGAYDGVADRISPFGGGQNDIPVLGDFDGNGTIDRAIYRSGLWFIDFDWSGQAARICAFGGLAGDIPVAADVDGDGVADLGIFRAGTWYFDTNCDGIPDRMYYFGAGGDRPFTGTFNTGNSIFVNATASPGGDGSQRSPVQTIAAALGLAGPGTNIRIAAGVYPDPVTFSYRTNLAFIGAGWTATHLTGSGADAFTAVLSSGIALRNLHAASPTDRGIINQGSSMTLDRVSTIGNFDHGMLVTGHLGTNAVASIVNSRLDQSVVGTGLRFAGGVTATVVTSCVCGNGTSKPMAPGGRGIEILSGNDVTIQFSQVSDNWDGGILVENFTSDPSTLTVMDSSIQFNGINGIDFGHNTSATIAHNVISYNGQRGKPGALTGANGIELLAGWSGAQMTIDTNTITYNTGNGVLVGSGGTSPNPVKVVNNFFDENWLGMTVYNDPTLNTFVLVQGNVFRNTTPLTENQTGLFIQRYPPGNSTVTIGGAQVAGTVALWLMNANGTVRTSLGLGTLAGWTPTVGDFNGDGIADILWQNTASGNAALWLMNANGTVRTSLGLGTLAGWMPTVGDFNGDGIADILWQNTASGNAALWLMNASGLVQSNSGLGNLAGWTPSIGDFNGDGKADVLWANRSTGHVVLWLMNGGSILNALDFGNMAPWTIEAVGDFNGDGKADILWVNPSTGNVTMWLMSGGSVSQIFGLGTMSPWTVAGVGDFNGDRKTDILWVNLSTGNAVLWLMNGGSILQNFSLGNMSPWRVGGVGDFNGDGFADILWQNTVSQYNAFYDFLARPSIACNSGTEITSCRLSWNTFTNSPGPGGSPVYQCNCPP
jgi:hypothetical protein